MLGKWGKGKPRVLAKDWEKPVRWNRDFAEAIQLADRCFPYRDRSQDAAHLPRVFPSMCDPFDEEVPIEWLARFLRLIHDTPHLDWLLLTKRPALFGRRLAEVEESCIEIGGKEMMHWRHAWTHNTPPSNVWIGTSVEDQPNADRRIPELLKIPAKIRFLSVEPMLGPVDLKLDHIEVEASFRHADDCKGFCDFACGGEEVKGGIDWVIVGGESGPGARPCNVEWVLSVVDQCAKASVPCFVKQLGSKAVESDFQHTKECWNENCALAGGPGDCDGEVVQDSLCLSHPKGGDPEEWPDDLRVRQFPEVVR